MIHKVRKTRITKNEIISDIIFLLFGVIIMFLFIFAFDIHWSFYEYPIFPLQHVFQSSDPYIFGIGIGTIIIFLLIKLLLFGIHEKEGRK